MLDTQKAPAPCGTSLYPVGAYRAICRCVSGRRVHCSLPCQTRNVSPSWLGLSDGCGGRSTELKRFLRMEPLKQASCAALHNKHRKACRLAHERGSSGAEAIFVFPTQVRQSAIK